MIYNRRKRAQFYQEQKALHSAAVDNARQAIEQGRASKEDVEFIKREDEETARVERVKAEKAEKKGIFAMTKGWLFSGLKKEDEAEGGDTEKQRIGQESLSEDEDDAFGKRENDIKRTIQDKKETTTSRMKLAFAEEKERQKSGGPLDRLGTPAMENTVSDDEQPKSRGWTSFMTRR